MGIATATASPAPTSSLPHAWGDRAEEEAERDWGRLMGQGQVARRLDAQQAGHPSQSSWFGVSHRHQLRALPQLLCRHHAHFLGLALLGVQNRRPRRPASLFPSRPSLCASAPSPTACGEQGDLRDVKLGAGQPGAGVGVSWDELQDPGGIRDDTTEVMNLSRIEAATRTTRAPTPLAPREGDPLPWLSAHLSGGDAKLSVPSSSLSREPHTSSGSRHESEWSSRQSWSVSPLRSASNSGSPRNLPRARGGCCCCHITWKLGEGASTPLKQPWI